MSESVFKVGDLAVEKNFKDGRKYTYLILKINGDLASCFRLEDIFYCEIIANHWTSTGYWDRFII